MPDPIQNAGQFGATAYLPNTPGMDPASLFPGPVQGTAPDWSFLSQTPWDALTRMYGGNLSGAGVFGQPQQSGNSFNPADLWTRIDPNMGYIDPSVTINPANPADYPVPGGDTSGAQPQKPSILSRILNNIPAVRVAKTIGKIFQPHGSGWQQNAASNPVYAQPPIPIGGALLGFNPNQAGGGTTRFNYGTGTETRTPSTNPLFNTGSGWQPVANAPVDLRFAPNSGTGNWQADQTTKGFELSGGYPGTPNRAGTTTDRGLDRFMSGPAMQYDAEGGFSPTDQVRNGPTANDPRWVYPSQAESNALGLTFDANNKNEWLIEHNPWFYASATNSNALQPFGWMGAAGGKVSGPPKLPDWLFGT